MTDYFKNPAISASGLKLIDRSPAHFFESRTNPKESTDPQKFGTFAHCAILEPQEFDNRFTMIPEGINFTTKEGKEIRATIIASGKEAVKYEAMQDILKIQAIFQSHPFVVEMNKCNPEFEKEHYYYFDGIAAKMKTDIIIQPCASFPTGLVFDLKTTTDASPESWARTLWNGKGYIQVAWYIDSFQRIYGTVPDFVFGVIEKSSPYLMAFYRPPAHLIEYGREECNRLLGIYNECMNTGVWAGYPSGVNELVLPSWAENVISGGVEVEINFVDDNEEQT